MDALRALGDEIPKKDELYYFAIKMFQMLVKREVFLNLDLDVRVWRLRREYAEQNQIASFSSLEEYVLSIVLVQHETYFTMQPCMNSNYTCQMWVDEVLNGHDDRCMNSFRMPKNIFHSLLHDLQANYGLKHGKVSAMEKLALSLYILGNRESNSNAIDRFQRSGETVSRILTNMLHIFARMGIDTIKPTEGQSEEVPNRIRHGTRYWPHFKDCLGAIDGTHIKACILHYCQIPYIGWKGEPTQNIMAVCDFNMCFIFIFPGWEGTAHDRRILLQPLRKQELKFPHPPPGKYYLVDSGYPQMAVIATTVLHNYIRRHAWSNDEDFRQFENIPDMPVFLGHFDRDESSSSNSESDLEIAMLRETIATSLMNQYL
ncbi:hypothetical protein J1N35_022160 [Gossypium stocksii]|uniref:DDE Tnp4 domain-containing protein n=1 Tax=Gossypium stocksii TaxID=47602 RepID=A0A9D3VI10_9ROSI|nr:hypothetical protein J1N35_022160 [Gossypium stocksii]